MTRQQLRVFLDGWFCGCGARDAAAARLRDVLALHPLYEHRADIERLLPDRGIHELILYTLDHFDLTEHGGAIGGGWLTGKGREVLDALNREVADGFETVTAQACMHGYAIDDELHECAECAKL